VAKWKYGKITQNWMLYSIDTGKMLSCEILANQNPGSALYHFLFNSLVLKWIISQFELDSGRLHHHDHHCLMGHEYTTTFATTR
jgi:hypothetical protein